MTLSRKIESENLIEHHAAYRITDHLNLTAGHVACSRFGEQINEGGASCCWIRDD